MRLRQAQKLRYESGRSEADARTRQQESKEEELKVPFSASLEQLEQASSQHPKKKFRFVEEDEVDEEVERLFREFDERRL